MSEHVKDSFDEISPVSGKLTVLVEGHLRVDLELGYQNVKDVWTEDNPEELAKLEESLPSYILPFKFIAEDRNVWYPMLAFKHSGVLFPIADPTSGFIWAVSKVEKLTNKEDLNTHFVVNLPVVIDGKEQIGLFKVHNEPIQTFRKDEFERAFDLYNSLGHGENE